MFDHSYFQNINSQSQNRCFKEFAWGGAGGVETLIGRMPLEHAVSLHGSSLRWWRLKTNLKWRYFYVFVQSTAVFMFPGPTQFEGLFSDRDQTSRYTQCKSLFSVFRIRVTKRFFVQYIFVNLHPPLFSWASISSTYPCQSVRKSVRP